MTRPRGKTAASQEWEGNVFLAAIGLIAFHLMQPAGELFPRLDCIPRQHEPARVWRLPGVSATTARPQNPLEDAWPHCYR